MLYNKKNILIFLGIILIISVWTVFFFNQELFTLEFLFQNIDALNRFINQNTYFSFFLFILSYFILVIFNFPAASLLSLTGGFLFGTWLGGVGIIVGGACGSFIVFIFAKSFFLNFINQNILSRYPRIPNYFKSNDLELMMLIRLIPGIPFFAQNLILAALGAKNKRFFLTTLIGLTPWAFIFASIGQTLDDIFYHQQALTINFIMQPKYIIPIGIIILLLVLILIYKKKLKKII